MQLLDGKKLSNKIELQITEETKKLKETCGCTPGLAVVFVGQDHASEAYVNMKKKACDRAGFYSITHDRPETISQEAIEKTIVMLNNDTNVDGILIQLPLPDHIDTTKLLELVAPEKDVDGFHPTNFGKMALDMSTFIPATPFGILELLDRYQVETSGKHTVVIGRSHIV